MNLSFPLHEAVKRHSESVCRKLLEKNVNVNAQDDDGRTALHEACKQLQYRIAKIFMTEKECNVGLQDVFGRTPLHELACAINSSSFQQSTQIMIAELLFSSPSQSVHYLLAIQDQYGFTPLHVLIQTGEVSTKLEFLKRT